MYICADYIDITCICLDSLCRWCDKMVEQSHVRSSNGSRMLTRSMIAACWPYLPTV